MRDKTALTEDLRKFGAPAHVLAQFEEQESEVENEVTLDVRKDLWLSFEVYRYTYSEVSIGLSAALYTGMRPSEIYSVCRLLLIKREHWPQILEDVTEMSKFASNIKNTRKS